MKPSYDLVAGFISGDARAFRKIYAHYCPELCFFARSYVSRPEDAEEIVADIFIKLWHRHAQFETAENIKAFLFISTRNACLNFIRLHPASRQPVSIDNIEGGIEATDLEAYHREITAELLGLVSAHLRALSPQRKAIVEMILFDGLSDTEIAARLGISARTLRNQKGTAVRQLQVALGRRASVVLPLLTTLLINR